MLSGHAKLFLQSQEELSSTNGLSGSQLSAVQSCGADLFLFPEQFDNGADLRNCPFGVLALKFIEVEFEEANVLSLSFFGNLFRFLGL